MRNYTNYLFILFFLLLACSKEYIDDKLELVEIDCLTSEIEGSFVQNAEMSASNRYILQLSSPGNGTAVISANEVNGLYVSENAYNLTNSSSIEIPIEGKPIETGEYALKIRFSLHGKDFFCSQIFEVFEDNDPSAPITFTIDGETFVGLNEELDIPFTVDPPGASVLVNSPVEGLIVQTSVDKQTGAGNLKLIPSDSFFGGDLGLSITYGVRQEVTKTLGVSAFASGAGIAENPFEINSPELLRKVRYGLDKAYEITNDIDLTNATWHPVGTSSIPFTGILDGGDHMISNLRVSGTNYVGFIAYAGNSAVLKNIRLSGEVDGEAYVAGLVAVNNGASITNCNATDVTITGVNYMSSLVASNLSGTITGSKPAEDQVLIIESFPTQFSGLGTDSKPFVIQPQTAVVTLVNVPADVVANIENGSLEVSAAGGFVSGEMEAEIVLGKVSTKRTISLFAEEQFDDGDGSQSAPFIISNANQFSKIRDFSSAHFRLATDVNLTDLEEWVAIAEFSGVLDGNSKSVSGLSSSNMTTKGGLFIINSGVIKNLQVPDINITTQVAFGVIAGDNSGTIENVAVTGVLVSTNTGDLLGGIAAEMTSGTISNCYVDIDMTASCGMVGGILGRARTSPSVVSYCTVKGKIDITGSKSRIAGVVGRAETAVVITNCHSAVHIEGIAEGVNGVGGIFGADNGAAMRIEECLFTGSIVASSNVGGIAGVGPNVKNCLVQGLGANAVESTLRTTGAPNPGSLGGITGINKGYLTHSIARDMTLRGVAGNNAKLAGIASVYQNNGYVANSVVTSSSIESSMVQRVSGSVPGLPSVLANNYASDMEVTLTEGAFEPDNNKDGLDGETKNSGELTQSFYESLGFDFVSVWKWENNSPALRNVGYYGNLPVN